MKPQEVKDKGDIEREINILKLLKHPNIVELYESIHDEANGKVYLVLELVNGGELFDCIFLIIYLSLFLSFSLSPTLLIHSFFFHCSFSRVYTRHPSIPRPHNTTHEPHLYLPSLSPFYSFLYFPKYPFLFSPLISFGY